MMVIAVILLLPGCAGRTHHHRSAGPRAASTTATPLKSRAVTSGPRRSSEVTRAQVKRLRLHMRFGTVIALLGLPPNTTGASKSHPCVRYRLVSHNRLELCFPGGLLSTIRILRP